METHHGKRCFCRCVGHAQDEMVESGERWKEPARGRWHALHFVLFCRPTISYTWLRLFARENCKNGGYVSVAVAAAASVAVSASASASADATILICPIVENNYNETNFHSLAERKAKRHILLAGWPFSLAHCLRPLLLRPPSCCLLLFPLAGENVINGCVYRYFFTKGLSMVASLRVCVCGCKILYMCGWAERN